MRTTQVHLVAAEPSGTGTGPRNRSVPWAAALAAAVLATALAGCGGDSGEGSSPVPAASPDGSAAPAPDAPADDSAASPADGEAAAPAAGFGSASLTVGSDTWDFTTVQCAFGAEQIGQEGAEFNLSAIQDGLQFYLSIDSYGHSASLKDIQDFENPSVSLDTAFGPSGDSEFIEVDGKAISGEAEFLDDTSDPPQAVAGSFEATCP